MSWPPAMPRGSVNDSTASPSPPKPADKPTPPMAKAQEPGTNTAPNTAKKADAPNNDQITIHVQLPSGRIVDLDLLATTRIHEVKETLHDGFTHIVPASQQLIRQGAALVDQLSLCDCGIKDGETLWLFRKAGYASRVKVAKDQKAAAQDKGDDAVSFSVLNAATQDCEERSMPGSATIKDLKKMLLATEFTRIPVELQEIRRRWPPATFKDGQTRLECVTRDCEMILNVKDFDASLQRRRRRHRSSADMVFEKPAPCVLM